MVLIKGQVTSESEKVISDLKSKIAEQEKESAAPNLTENFYRWHSCARNKRTKLYCRG